MKKGFLILLLAMSVLVSACASKQTAPQATQARIETAETTAAVEDTQEPSVSETESATETLDAVELEPIVEDTVFVPGSIQLDPAELKPDGGVWALGGSVVYFGKYDGLPMAYRVLDLPDTQTVADGVDSLLLDCGSVLKTKAFDDNFARNEGQIRHPSEWKASDIEVWLNGNDFYGNSSVFSELERAAIASTTLADVSTPYSAGNWTYVDYGSTDYIFLLSAAEADRLYAENAARAKDGKSICWWLRSTFGDIGNGSGSIHGDGHVCNNSISNFGVGVSPALNIKLSSILFVSAIEPDQALDLAETGPKEWKLTLLDTSKAVKVTEGQTVMRTATDAGTVISVPYTYSGDKITRISVMITDKAYTDNGVQVLHYGALRGGTAGTGTFILPPDLENQVWGTDYYVYILAEDRNGNYATNYASDLCAVTIAEESMP